MRPLLGSLRRGGGNSRESCVYCFGPPCPPSGVRPAQEMGPEAPQTSFLVWFAEGNPRKRRVVPIATSILGLGWALPWNGSSGVPEKSPKPAGPRPKRCFSSRGVDRCPPRPGLPGPNARDVLPCAQKLARFLHRRATPSSRLVRVDGSRKLPQIILCGYSSGGCFSQI